MKNIALSSKIILAAAISGIISLIVGLVVYFNMARMISYQDEMSRSQETLQRFNRLKTYIMSLETGERGFLLTGETEYYEPFNAAEDVVNGFIKGMKEDLKDNPELLSRIETISGLKREWMTGPVLKEMMGRRRLDAGLIQYKEFHTIFRTSKGKEICDRIYREIDAAITSILREVEDVRTRSKGAATNTRLRTVLGLSAGSVLGFLLLLVIARRASNSLVRGVLRLRTTSSEINGLSVQIAESSGKLAASALEAADALNATSSATRDLASKVAMNARTATVAKGKTQDCCTRALEGEAQIRQLISSVRESAEASKKIEEISSMIDDIAFQTNLLALNAAVEAARAGEQGKGFGVVAEAVRALAQKSTDSAKQIGTLIKDAVARTEHGMRLASSSESSFAQIVSDTREVSKLAASIAEANQEQSQAVQRISENLAQLDTETQSTARSATGFKATSGSLRSQACLVEEMTDTLDRLLGESSSEKCAR